MTEAEHDPRPDWHDQDLLTNAEAAGRLVAEVAATRARLDALPAEDARRAELSRRLNAMEDVLRDLRAR